MIADRPASLTTIRVERRAGARAPIGVSIRCALCGATVLVRGGVPTVVHALQSQGDLCPDCLAAGPERAAERARAQIERLSAQIAAVECLSERLAAVPPAEWRAAQLTAASEPPSRAS